MSLDRERFQWALDNEPASRADAIVVCCGEDAEPRVNAAVELFKLGVAPYIVASGGIHEPPRWTGAEACFSTLMGKGVAFDRIICEMVSQNTHDQATEVVGLACEREWKRLILVASNYHIARAFLTFLKALMVVEKEESIRLIPVSVKSPRWGSPAGMHNTRLNLLAGEAAKIETYQARDHVAQYQSGLHHLSYWEGKP